MRMTVRQYLDRQAQRKAGLAAIREEVATKEFRRREYNRWLEREAVQVATLVYAEAARSARSPTLLKKLSSFLLR